VIDEATVLRQLLAQPDDLALRMVYADLLEERGDDDRARFVRHQSTLLASNFADPHLTALRDEAISLGRRVPRAWLRRMRHPIVTGTWNKIATDGYPENHDRNGLIRLLDDDLLEFVQWWDVTPGTWKQFGCVVQIVINRWSTYTGVVIGGELRGHGRNKDGLAWSFEATMVEEATP
jgi:uncharacterized protein (TIGR02996 family)